MNDHKRADAAALVEAILLVSPRPVTFPALLSATALLEDEVRASLEELEKRYSLESSGIVLREVAEGYGLFTSPLCAEAVERFRREARPAPLSGAAHEVLSCVLYLGPVVRADVNAVRGVNSDAVVRGLLERNLLTETGRDETKPGAPALLDITEDFLIAAGARDRHDFPALEDLVDDGEVERIRGRIRKGADEVE